MTLLETVVAWASAPLLGWGWSVEKRLAKLDAIKEKVDSTDARTQALYVHFLGDRSGPDSSREDQKGS